MYVKTTIPYEGEEPRVLMGLGFHVVGPSFSAGFSSRCW
jgi:hypothetical protein